VPFSAEIHTLESLPPGHLAILRSALSLARDGCVAGADIGGSTTVGEWERLQLSEVDVVKNQTHAQCIAASSSARLEISEELFEPVHAHHETHIGPCPMRRTPTEDGSATGASDGDMGCRCCEVAVAAALLACVGAGARVERRAWAVAANAHLSANERSQSDAPGDSPASAVLPAQASEFTERERSLRAALAETQRLAEQQAAANATELATLQSDLKKLEQQIVAEDVRRANESIRARCVRNAPFFFWRVPK
jgi:hypothetical protein